MKYLSLWNLNKIELILVIVEEINILFILKSLDLHEVVHSDIHFDIILEKSHILYLSDVF